MEKILLKKRKIQNMYFYDTAESIELPIEDGLPVFSENILGIREGDTFDCEDSNNLIYLTNDEYVSISDDLEMKTYKNSRNETSLYIRAKNRFVLKKVDVSSESVTISIDFNSKRKKIDVENLFISVGDGLADFNAVDASRKNEGNSIVFMIEKNVFDDLFSSPLQLAALYLGNEAPKCRVFATKEDIEGVAKGKFGEALIKSNRRIKLAILGSCYSRRMFTSTQYFNPDYKDFFEVLGTQFQSSLIGIAPETKINEEYPQETFISQPASVQNSVKNELQNSYFEELKELNPDYLLIDVYGDVDRGVVIFPNGKMITNTNYVEYKTEFLQERFFKTLKAVDDFSEYESLFIGAVKNLKNELKKIIPEHKIIFNRIQLATDYINDEGLRRKFGKRAAEIRNKNMIADHFLTILKKEFPDAIILDNEFNGPYIASAESPDGLNYNHYESKYYKDKMDKLKELIVK